MHLYPFQMGSNRMGTMEQSEVEIPTDSLKDASDFIRST